VLKLILLCGILTTLGCGGPEPTPVFKELSNDLIGNSATKYNVRWIQNTITGECFVVINRKTATPANCPSPSAQSQQ
jgi:hypothetical protein